MNSGGIIFSELLGILDGLKLAWHLGYKRVWLESDSEEALALVEHRCPRNNPNHQLVAEIEEMMALDWTVQWTHAYREQNRVADWLAKLGQKMPTGFHVLHAPPEGCTPPLNLDSRDSNILM